jgi:hypothetical protein
LQHKSEREVKPVSLRGQIYIIQNDRYKRGFLQILVAGEANMSQAESEQVIEHVNKLLTHADELRKVVNELYEKTKSSEIVANLERLVEIRDALANFVARKANEFSVTLIDACASDNCEDIDVLIKRPGFHLFFRVKRNASLIEIYQMFFDSKKALEKLITDLVTAIISVTRKKRIYWTRSK